MTARAMLARVFNRRIRVTHDDHPHYGKLFHDRYRWMELNNLKVSPAVLDNILTARKIPNGIEIQPDKRLAVIIPFRNRHAHLQALLPRLENELQKQQVRYRVFVVEQSDEKLFNRAKLLNVGAHIAGEQFDYYCFHDVDLIPVDCCYGCPTAPLRLHSTIRTRTGKRQYSNVTFSGVVSIPRALFLAANGFSNEFWHWGKEDDNFLLRLLLAGIHPAVDTRGVFTELDDSSDRNTLPGDTYSAQNRADTRKLREANRKRQALAATGKLSGAEDGMSSLEYQLVNRVSKTGYELLQVNL